VDPGAALRGLLVMSQRVVDAHVHGVCREALLGFAQLGHDHGAVAEHELRTVICDAKTFLEAERFAEPVTSFGHVGVGEHRDDRRCWD
jgi:hypothetical protein